MKQWFRNFMYGRYGADQLSIAILWAFFFIWIISLFTKGYLRIGLNTIGNIIILFGLYRMFSKKYYVRRSENQWYLSHTDGIRKMINRYINQFKYRKEYKYFTCPACKQHLRVPRGKGNITINCPNCHQQFDAKS